MQPSASAPCRSAPQREASRRRLRALAPQILDRSHRLLAQPRGLDRLGGVDHFLERRSRPASAAVGLRLLEHREQLHVAHRVARQRELRHVAEREQLDAVAVVRVRQHGDDARDRAIASAREIVAPVGVEQLRRRLELLARAAFLAVAEIGVVGEVVAHASVPSSVPARRDLEQRRRLVGEIVVDHHLARRHAVGEHAQQVLPVRMRRIGDRAHDHPVVLLRQRKHLADQLFGAFGIGADHAGDEADIGARLFRILERAHPAQGLDHVGHARRVRLLPVGVDPAQHRIRRQQVDQPHRLRRAGRPRSVTTNTILMRTTIKRPPHPPVTRPRACSLASPADAPIGPEHSTAFDNFMLGTGRPCAKVVAQTGTEVTG